MYFLKKIICKGLPDIIIGTSHCFHYNNKKKKEEGEKRKEKGKEKRRRRRQVNKCKYFRALKINQKETTNLEDFILEKWLKLCLRTQKVNGLLSWGCFHSPPQPPPSSAGKSNSFTNEGLASKTSSFIAKGDAISTWGTQRKPAILSTKSGKAEGKWTKETCNFASLKLQF